MRPALGLAVSYLVDIFLLPSSSTAFFSQQLAASRRWSHASTFFFFWSIKHCESAAFESEYYSEVHMALGFPLHHFLLLSFFSLSFLD